MPPDLVILDYGMGNLRSVQKACEAVGHAATVTGDPARAALAAKLILPGVGAFRDAIGRLRETGLDSVVKRHADAGRPLLGVCLGMQLLFERGYEDGAHEGLGILAGEVVPFTPRPGLKIPHMGWNTLTPTEAGRGCPLFVGMPADAAVYFVHGYCCVPADPGVSAAQTDYPTPFCSAAWRGNVMATQFHPEKSQAVGLAMLRNFAAW